MGLFLLVIALEVWPMMTFISWRRALGRGRVPDTSVAPTLSRVNHAELALAGMIVFVASFMARGFLVR
jgi:putative membrane protein